MLNYKFIKCNCLYFLLLFYYSCAKLPPLLPPCLSVCSDCCFDFCCPLWYLCPSCQWVEFHHLAPETPESNYCHCICIFQLSCYVSSYKFWSTENSSHGAFQRCWGSSHKLISSSISEKCVFWTLAVWVSMS